MYLKIHTKTLQHTNLPKTIIFHFTSFLRWKTRHIFLSNANNYNTLIFFIYRFNLFKLTKLSVKFEKILSILNFYIRNWIDNSHRIRKSSSSLIANILLQRITKAHKHIAVKIVLKPVFQVEKHKQQQSTKSFDLW